MIQSKLLLQFPELVHGYSDRLDGDMGAKRLAGETYGANEQAKWLANRQRIFDRLGIPTSQVILARQTHSATVESLNLTHMGKAHDNLATFASADSFILTDPDIFATVFTADCLPIFCYEPKKRIVAAMHAGWRGIASGIIKTSIMQIRSSGGMIEDLRVWIGPHIKVCHYDADPTVDSFVEKQKAFQNAPGILIEKGNKKMIDLTALAVRQLTEASVFDQHLEIGDCTVCEREKYYSYHAVHGKNIGRMMGVIGVRNSDGS